VLGALPSPPVAPNGTVTAVLSAVYAKNCNNPTNLVAQANSVCVGEANCSWSVCVEGQPSCPPGSPNAIPDPAFDCMKDLSVSWQCSGDSPGAPPRYNYVAKPAEGVWAQITCYDVPPSPAPFGSQQTDIFWYMDSQGEKQYMYIGDHWQSAPDGLKAHDFTVWAPLVFDATGNVTSPGFLPQFKVDVGN